MEPMDFEFDGPVVEWRGPAPYYFLRIPAQESANLKSAASGVEYWGQVPVEVRIGDVAFEMALFPREGHYLVPLKKVVRESAGIEVDHVLAAGVNIRRR